MFFLSSYLICEMFSFSLTLLSYFFLTFSKS
nr:MAG TPA_asm: hypothetical protein [Caudoviricetes sp.]